MWRFPTFLFPQWQNLVAFADPPRVCRAERIPPWRLAIPFVEEIYLWYEILVRFPLDVVAGLLVGKGRDSGCEPWAPHDERKRLACRQREWQRSNQCMGQTMPRMMMMSESDGPLSILPLQCSTSVHHRHQCTVDRGQILYSILVNGLLNKVFSKYFSVTWMRKNARSILSPYLDRFRNATWMRNPPNDTKLLRCCKNVYHKFTVINNYASWQLKSQQLCPIARFGLTHAKSSMRTLSSLATGYIPKKTRRRFSKSRKYEFARF